MKNVETHEAALRRLAGFLDGLRTPIDGWQVAKQMQQIAREALGEEKGTYFSYPEVQTIYFIGDQPNAD